MGGNATESSTSGRYGTEDGRGKRAGYGAMGDSRSLCCVRGGWCPSCSRCAAGRSFERRAAWAQRMDGVRREAMKAAPRQRAVFLVAAQVVCYVRSSEGDIDSVEKASGASEEAQLCRTDGGADLAHRKRYDAAARFEWRGPEHNLLELRSRNGPAPQGIPTSLLHPPFRRSASR
ncbi:hypothetical protein DFH07DRAFT_798156 [Mycena maculata]|uniref:Uncharacterized protein n=1 Tax=Mycena maculata TaxID=230809 RepID=A0AAD7K2K5_9AGAR|nr:hypothetical protein DFH07DRAFT_798156 [Mycena maculata]